MNASFKQEQYIKGPGMPLRNSADWNPALHPRDPSNGEFIYTDGGLHGRSSSRQGKPLGKSAIENALALTINQNTSRRNATATNPYFSHYGYGNDRNWDRNSNLRRLGNHENTLNSLSLSISSDVARANHIRLGDSVYVNGTFLGHYDDSPAPWVHNTIDVYDPNNQAGSQKWGGMVQGGATISSSR